MVQHLVLELVLDQGVVPVFGTVGVPVLGQLLGTEDEDVLVPRFVVFDHTQRRVGLSESDTVGQDASVECLQFVDDPENRILLE